MMTHNEAAKYIIENSIEGMHYEVFQKWVKVYTRKGTFKIQREAINRFDVIGNGDMLAGISEVEAIEFIKGVC